MNIIDNTPEDARNQQYFCQTQKSNDDRQNFATNRSNTSKFTSKDLSGNKKKQWNNTQQIMPLR